MAELYGREWTRAELIQYVGHMDQIAGIRAQESVDGTAKDSRAFQVYTGSGLSFRVLADRALDISACQYRGKAVAWASAVGEVHPAYYETEGLGWLRSFPGGLMTTCGLDHFGAPIGDYGIHGRISNLPAKQASYRTYWQDDEYMLEITGQVRQARLFGENLVLKRRIWTQLGSSTIWVEDSVTNEGFEPVPHMILYHCNLGFPLINSDTVLHIDAEQTIARDADAEVGLHEWMHFQAPTPGYSEQVFRHAPRADEAGWVTVRVQNPMLKLQLRYDSTTLPHLFQWKMMGQGAYVLGIEPANSADIEGKRQDVPMLEAGESRTYSLEFTIS